MPATILYYLLMHTARDFALTQNGVGGQVNAVQRVTPIDPMPMGMCLTQ